MERLIWIEWIGIWGSGKSTTIRNLIKDSDIEFNSTKDYFIANRTQKIITFFKISFRSLLSTLRLFSLLLPPFLKAFSKKDSIIKDEFRSFLSCYLARLSFKYNLSKKSVLWEGEMHLIPILELDKKIISKIIDILLFTNREVIHAVVVIEIDEDVAFRRIMDDKKSEKNIRFNKNQNFTIEHLRRFRLYQKKLIEVLKEKGIHVFESDGDLKLIKKFISQV